MKNEGFTLRKRLRSFKFAGNGIRLLITREHNAWIHCFCRSMCNPAGWLIGLLPLMDSHRVCHWFRIGLQKQFNSSIEALADLVSPEYNEAIKRTKDLAAGAVLILAISAAIVGLIIFIPKILTLS